MQYLFMVLFVAGATALDQLTKFLVVENISLYGHVEFIPDVLSFTYVQNTGAAFSSFRGMQWLFLVVFIVFTAGVVWEFAKKKMPFTTFERWCIAAIYAGGLGNMIDRLRLGYVVDMVKTEFMNFPVFNVADCFITCGCILLLVHLFFFNKEFWKDDKKK
jgi:signal peptidase II